MAPLSPVLFFNKLLDGHHSNYVESDDESEEKLTDLI